MERETNVSVGRWLVEPLTVPVSLPVAGTAPQFELIDDGVTGLFERWVVVVIEHRVSTTVDAGPIPFLDHSFLSDVGMALAA